MPCSIYKCYFIYGSKNRIFVLAEKWTTFKQVRFQALSAGNVKVTVFWDVVPCSLVEVYQCLRGAYCLHLEGTASKMIVIFTCKHFV
jgi:hypothetical protein